MNECTSGLYVIEKQLRSIASAMSNEWYRLQCKHPYDRLYVWYRSAKPGEKIAIPVIAENKPADGYGLVNQRISPAWSKDEARAKFIEWMRQLPILGE